MSGAGLIVFSFLVGLAVAGMAASLAEMRYRRPASFRLVVAESPVGPVLGMLVIAAGPFMLLNDSLAAIRDSRAGISAVLVAAIVAIPWLTALGIVVIELGWQLSQITL